MTLTYRGAVAVVQLVVFVPALCFALFLASRHGFGKSAGWYFLILLSLLRIAGGISEIIAVYKPSVGAITAAVVCISIGVAPLVALCSGLLSRVNDQVNHRIPPIIFKATGLLGLIGAILGITGGTQTSSTDFATLHVNTMVKVAVVIFLVILIVVTTIFLIISTRLSEIPQGERRIMVAVGLSLPFLWVRILYSLLSDFAHNKKFSSAFGSVTIFLCMAVIEEIIVAIIVIAVGLTLKIRPKAPQTDEAHQMGETDGGRKLVGQENEFNGQTTTRPRRKFKGPISWLFFTIKDSIDERRQRT